MQAARYRLEQNMLFQGTVTGKLPQDEAGYTVEVKRQGALARPSVAAAPPSDGFTCN